MVSDLQRRFQEREIVSDLQRRVLDAVQAGVSSAEIESSLIEPARLDEDEKAALWLYAGSLRDLRGCGRRLAIKG